MYVIVWLFTLMFDIFIWNYDKLIMFNKNVLINAIYIPKLS